MKRPLSLSFAASAAIQVLGVATGVLLARTLGPEARGELAAVLLWPMVIVAAGSAGVTDAVAYYAAREKWPLRTLAATTLGVALALSLVLTGIGFGAISLALSGQDPDVRAAGYLFLANVPLAMVALGAAYLFNGLHRFGWFNAIRVSVVGASAVGLVALAVVDRLTVTNATVAYLVGTLLTVVVAIVGLRRVVGQIGRWSRRVACDVLVFGVKGQLSAVSNVLNERVDQLVISVALPPAKLGLYVVAWTLAAPVALLGISIGFTALPVVAGGRSAADRTAAACRYVSLAALVSVAVAVPLALVAPTLIDLCFGGRFAGASESARVLVVAGALLGVGRTLGAVLKGVGRPLDAGVAELIGLGVTAVGLAALLPTMGILGAAITSLVAYTASMAYALRRASRAFGAGTRALLIPTRETVVGPLRRLLSAWR